MKTNHLLAMIAITVLLASCGGSGSDVDSDTAPAPGPSPAPMSLSQTQQNFIASAVSNSYAHLYWKLPESNTSPVDGTHYFVAAKFSFTASPAQGAQEYVRTVENMSTNLSVPNSATLRPYRAIKNGAIYAVDESKSIVEFKDEYVQAQLYATDGRTKLHATLFDFWGELTNLSGALASSDILKNYYGFSRLPTPSNLDMAVAWRPGSSYVLRKRLNVDEVIRVIDWREQTVDANVIPWSGTQTTLETMFAYVTRDFGGLTLSGTTYQIGDGEIQTKEAVRIWIAKNLQPVSASPSGSYACMFELNGKLYYCTVTLAGTREKRVSGLDSTIVLDDTVRFNATAIQSIKDAVRF